MRVLWRWGVCCGIAVAGGVEGVLLHGTGACACVGCHAVLFACIAGWRVRWLARTLSFVGRVGVSATGRRVHGHI